LKGGCGGGRSDPLEARRRKDRDGERNGAKEDRWHET
jgi:hypothetical protein